MQTIYIKFLSEADRATGFLEVAKRARISSLPCHVYQVPIAATTILDDIHVDYRRATDAEVQHSQNLASLAMAR